MFLEIVTHCWAGHLDSYAKALWWQICSIKAMHRTDVKLVVYGNQEDANLAKLKPHFPPFVEYRELPQQRLFRRAIGRNDACLKCESDLLWLADADYIFTNPAIDAIQKLQGNYIYYPKSLLISKTHEIGQADLDAVDLDHPVVMQVDVNRFTPKHYANAIGGVQLVPGHVAALGYLKDTKWMDAKGDKIFQDTPCDVAYRTWLKERRINPRSIDMSALFRLRHLEKGREYSNVPKCECIAAGWCNRHRMNKTPHWFNLCRERPDYREMWDKKANELEVPAE